jgi:lipopolysaccharide biosynthesis protein
MNIRDLYTIPRRLISQGIDSSWAFFIHAKNLILEEWNGNPGSRKDSQSKKRMVWFAHFDPQHKIDNYVLFYIQKLFELGADIIFVSSSENLSSSEVQKILPYCLKVVRRKNIGLDFGSWKVAQITQEKLQLELSLYDELILANDSVYGPFQQLSDLFNRMTKRDLDLWAMSSSLEQSYHLQSYFLVFHNRILKKQAFQKFWESYRFYHSKHRIIQNYEIGLSRFGKQNNWKLGAYLEAEMIDPGSLNPTLFAWDQMIEEFSFPFLKTEVLKLNRASSPRLTHWKEIISNQSNYDTNLIANHLTRIGVHLKDA